MKRTEDKNSCQVSFSKRRTGLINKARHLSVLCDVDIAVIVFSANGKLYESCSGTSSNSVEDILSRYQKSCIEARERTNNGASGDLEVLSQCPKFRTCKELLQTVDRLVEENNSEELSVTDMTDLEQELDAALVQTRLRKTQLMMEYISTIQEEDKEEFKNDNRAGWTVLGYLTSMERMAASLGNAHMFKGVDLVFIPVSNGSHKFVMCFNFKNPAVMMIDNKKMPQGITGATSNDTNTSCMRVATFLHKHVGNLMKTRKHEKADDIIKTGITRGVFHWQTDKRQNDCGIFVMRHMEDYMGNNIIRWDCGLEDESRKQTSQLVKLRKKYAARLLLSDCNMHKDKFMKKMGKYRAVKDIGKTSKIPVRGV